MNIRHLVALTALSIVSSLSSAAPISKSQTQSITRTGQAFTFSFSTLPTVGSNGLLSIVLNGDYSTSDTSEYATLKLENISGTATLGAYTTSNTNAFANTINGLSLKSYERISYYGDDTQQTWTLALSDALLKSLLADSVFSASLTNSNQVDAYSQANPDFVKVSLDYASTDVPEPGTLALFGLGLAGAAAIARRRRA